MYDMDRLLATRQEFLLGRWLEDAKRWGENEQDRARAEWNARRVLTLWGTGVAIRDYARKEWSGMINDFYALRWKWFLREQGKVLAGDPAIVGESFQKNLLQWENSWAEFSNAYPTEPEGDSVAIARLLWKRYGHEFQPEAESLTTGKPATCSSALPPHPARLANDGFVNNTDRYWATDVGVHPGPAWWQVDLQKPTTVGRIVVVGFYGDARKYGFTIECSLDGENWERIADRRDNEEPSTVEGITVRISPRQMRYLRVNQSKNSANTGRHLVEVMAFAN
jgi:hypothetical protein